MTTNVTQFPAPSKFFSNGPAHTSDRDDWETPPYLFEALRREFDFNLDPCCKIATAKCKRFFAIDRGDDGLAESWAGSRAFMNPPYGTGIRPWMEKAAREAVSNNTLVVALIPFRCDTAWWHDTVTAHASEIRPIKGRVKFWLDGKEGGACPFASGVIVFRPGGRKSGLPTYNVQAHPRKWADLKAQSVLKAA